MKKTTFLLTIALVLFAFPLSAHASEEWLISETCTYHDDMFEHCDIVSVYNPDSDTITTTKTVDFAGRVTPPQTIEGIETRNGTTYRGTLSLTQYLYISGKTRATYKGTLYPVS